MGLEVYRHLVVTLLPLSVMNCPFIFTGQKPNKDAVISLDCEGVKLFELNTRGEKTGNTHQKAATIAVVGEGEKAKQIFTAFIYHNPNVVANYLTELTRVTSQKLGWSPMSLDYCRNFLLSFLFTEKPYIVGWDIQSDFSLLGITNDIPQLYGDLYYEKIIDLQDRMRRGDGTTAALKLVVEEFSDCFAERKMLQVNVVTNVSFDKSNFDGFIINANANLCWTFCVDFLRASML